MARARAPCMVRAWARPCGPNQQGALVVLRARVCSVTPLQLVTAAKGEKFAASFAAMMDAFQELELDAAIAQVRPHLP